MTGDISILPLFFHGVNRDIFTLNFLGRINRTDTRGHAHSHRPIQTFTRQSMHKRNVEALSVSIVSVDKQYTLHILSVCL
jgi:hypothetical protein